MSVKYGIPVASSFCIIVFYTGNFNLYKNEKEEFKRIVIKQKINCKL